MMLPWAPGVPPVGRVAILAAWVAIVFLLLLALGQRALLRTLLSDKTFLYQARAPTALLKVWFLAVRCLTRGKPLIYSFQVWLGVMRVRFFLNGDA